MEDLDGILPEGCSNGGGGGGGGGAITLLRSFVISFTASACSGNYVTFRAGADGGEGTYNYEWYEGYDGISYSEGRYDVRYSSVYSVQMPPGLDLYVKLKVTSGDQTSFSLGHIRNVDGSPNCVRSYKADTGETIFDEEGQFMKAFASSEAYPNPFNPSTVITYDLPESADVNLVVYDVAGREMARLVDGHQESGYYRVVFDASHLPSGVYLYRLQSGSSVVSKQIILLK